MKVESVRVQSKTQIKSQRQSKKENSGLLNSGDLLEPLNHATPIVSRKFILKSRHFFQGISWDPCIFLHLLGIPFYFDSFLAIKSLDSCEWCYGNSSNDPVLVTLGAVSMNKHLQVNPALSSPHQLVMLSTFCLQIREFQEALYLSALPLGWCGVAQHYPRLWVVPKGEICP